MQARHQPCNIASNKESGVLQTGTGTDPDQQLATELFRLAAAAGDPAAQGQMAMRLAFGLHPPGSAQGNSIKHFGEVSHSSQSINDLLHWESTIQTKFQGVATARGLPGQPDQTHISSRDMKNGALAYELCWWLAGAL